MTAWNAFEKASDEANTKSNARCAALPAEMKERPNYVDRLSMEEDAMKARVASIEAVKPTLTALYAVLTPEQKAILDRPRGMMAGGPAARCAGTAARARAFLPVARADDLHQVVRHGERRQHAGLGIVRHGAAEPIHR